MKKKRKKITITEILLLVLGVFYLFPIYILIVNSFKSLQDVSRSPYSLPQKVIFTNFQKIISDGNFLDAIKNNLVITFAVVITIITISSMTGYILVRKKTRFNGVIYIYFILGMLIPFQVYMISLIKELHFIGLLRTPLGLFVTYVAQFTPLSVFLYSGYVKSVPKDMEESGRIDGCGPFMLFFRIVYPILKPCTSSVVIIFSISVWNSFVQPVIILGTMRWNLLYVEVFKFVQDKYFHQWNMTFAACFLSLVPIAFLYVIMQNRIIGGLTSGAVKG